MDIIEIFVDAIMEKDRWNVNLYLGLELTFLTS